MRRFFEILGFLSLVCFSFFYTEKTIDVVKEVDDIMITLKEEEKKYNVKPENAKIDGQFMIPGISGKIVNREKSYEQMKPYGKFHPNLLKYDKVSPEVSIKNRYDKYIKSGNPKKRQVSLLFIIEEKSHPDMIQKILKKENAEATFFIDGNWLEKNRNKFLELIDHQYTIGNYSYQGNYQHESSVWVDTIIKKVGGQKNSYCLVFDEDEKAINICKLQKDYTIYPSIHIKENPYTEVTKSVQNGSMIAMKINSKIEEELPMILKYLKQKGYDIVNLNKMLEE